MVRLPRLGHETRNGIHDDDAVSDTPEGGHHLSRRGEGDVAFGGSTASQDRDEDGIPLREDTES
jgi:hypothetical protein